MRFFTFVFVILLAASFSNSRSPASIHNDAFTVGVSKGYSAIEYDFISEATRKMKFSRFRLVVFENASTGQKHLLEGKIDAIISKANNSQSLDNRFLKSDFPSGPAGSGLVVLFSPDSKELQEEFNKALAPPVLSSEHVAKIITRVDELKKELELLQKELSKTKKP